MEPVYSGEPLSENWQRFMILWSMTPEFFIGSCIICVLSILYVFCLATFSHYDCHRSHISESDGVLAERNYDEDFATKSRFMKKTSTKTNRDQLRNRKNPSLQHPAITDDISQNSASDTEEIETSSPIRKSLYALAAERVKSTLTEDQIQEEKEIQRKQLQAIFDLMKDKSDIFGIEEMTQIEEQLKYYS